MDLLSELPNFLEFIFWRLIAIVLAYFIGKWSVRKFKKRLRVELEKMEAQESLINLTDAIAPFIVWFLVILVVLILFGFPADTLLIGAAIFLIVIGIALRESLGNFSATVNFWMFKPFEAGHVIETGTTLGTVYDIEPFSTVIHAFDNKVHVLPNGKIQGDGLINYSKIGILREDLIFSISYQDDVHEAKKLLTTVLAQDDRVLKEPAPRIFVMELNDSSVDIAVRPYVAEEDYWSFQDDIVEAVKFHLENNGFTIPFPQQDIHLYQNSTEASEANREDVNKQ